MSFATLVGKKMTKNVKFMGEDIKINKLSVAQIVAIQSTAKEVEGSKDETKGFEILKTIIKSAVDDAAELTDDQFEGFPMDELSNLSNAIMTFSGIDSGKK